MGKEAGRSAAQSRCWSVSCFTTNKRSAVDAARGPAGPITRLSSGTHQLSHHPQPRRLTPSTAFDLPLQFRMDGNATERKLEGREICKYQAQKSPDRITAALEIKPSATQPRQDYLSRSAGLPAPWDTRICTLPLVKPGTGRRRGTCWAHTGPGRPRTAILNGKTDRNPQ